MTERVLYDSLVGRGMNAELGAEGVSSVVGAGREGKPLTGVPRKAVNLGAQHIGATLTIAVGGLDRRVGLPLVDDVGQGRDRGHETKEKNLQAMFVKQANQIQSLSG